jgi:hypothetical protein
MEQKAAMIWLDSGFSFEPVLQQCQRAGPREQLCEDSPNK